MCTVEIDLLNDHKAFIIDQLANSGYSVNTSEDIRSLCTKYLNLQIRTIPPQKRTILISNELSNKALPQNIHKNLDDIKKKAEKGENLIPYLSKNIRYIEYDDLLLNDWGIHHLHLSNELDKDGWFMKRADDLLFVYVNKEEIYFIDILEHKVEYVFASQHLMEIMHSNWPNLLNMLNVSPSSEPYTNEEISKARKAGLQPLLTLSDGTAVMSPGGGIATDGSNPITTTQVGDWLKYLRNLQELVINEKASLNKEIYENTGIKLEKLIFKLYFDNDKVSVLELNSNVLFNFPQFK